MESRNELNPEQALPEIPDGQGLKVGDLPIIGDPRSVDAKRLPLSSFNFLALTGGQNKVMGDHPGSLGEQGLRRQR